MKLRKPIYFYLLRLRGQRLSYYYKRYLKEFDTSIPSNTLHSLLSKLLTHCKHNVPYYTNIMRKIDRPFYDNPEEYLTNLPILTKDIIRQNFNELISNDIEQRKWCYNFSGGSTGEPIKVIQDLEYSVRSGAISFIFSKMAGREIGEYEIRLWGSERDIIYNNIGWKARLINKISNTIFVNAFRMTPERIRGFVTMINIKHPKLIIAYADSIYQVAKYCEKYGLVVHAQNAIITSAVTLHPFMREKIEKIFHCRVFNRYGSRETGDIACERPDLEGLWVAPWGNYVEVVDPEGNRVPEGTEGEILITSLSNFAMPIIRYRIGDIGTLSPMKSAIEGSYGQVLHDIIGRTKDVFKTKEGTYINPGYFNFFLFKKGWIKKYQIIQKSYSSIIFRIVTNSSDFQQSELHEISAKTKLVMGDNCQVHFEFVDEIPASNSGKYLYCISEIHH